MARACLGVGDGARETGHARSWDWPPKARERHGVGDAAREAAPARKPSARSTSRVRRRVCIRPGPRSRPGSRTPRRRFSGGRPVGSREEARHRGEAQTPPCGRRVVRGPSALRESRKSPRTGWLDPRRRSAARAESSVALAQLRRVSLAREPSVRGARGALERGDGDSKRARGCSQRLRRRRRHRLERVARTTGRGLGVRRGAPRERARTKRDGRNHWSARRLPEVPAPLSPLRALHLAAREAVAQRGIGVTMPPVPARNSLVHSLGVWRFWGMLTVIPITVPVAVSAMTVCQ